MKYSAIIDLPHSTLHHRRMPIQDRAAQFAPFAALTGHGEAVRETERLTDVYSELDDDKKELINAQLRMLSEHPAESVTVIYFKKDSRKDGGIYLTASGTVKRIDSYRQAVIFKNGTVIPFYDIRAIKGDLFNYLDF